MGMLLLTNGRIVDGTADLPSASVNILIENDVIREVGPKVETAKARRLDLGGRVVMPGLIDCHVHVIASNPNLGQNAMLPDSLVMARGIGIMNGMLMRGFTTVRDVGGADFGVKLAAEEGLVPMPRIVMSGKALSQTGGHCDFRGRFDDRPTAKTGFRLGALGRICDGIDECRRATREEIKGGADFIKIMANGGVASPTDPIHFLGFARDEIIAIVEEARNAGTYVSAHLYTDEAIRRAAECGVISIEHGNLVTPETARYLKEVGAYVVPTNVTFDVLAKEGAAMGLPPESVAKIEDVRGAGLSALKLLADAGVMMAFGTDLLGPMHHHQSDEFLIRARYLPAIEVIRSATVNAAKVVRMEGKLGVIAPEAHADLIVVDGDPLKKIELLVGQGRHMAAIMKDGRFVKNMLKG